MADAPDGAASSSAAGQEVLVVDADEQVVKGLDRLLTRVGLAVTGTPDPVRARDQLLNKFYAVALVDADTPTPGAGIELLQFARDKAPLTSVIVMSSRKSYETSVKAFRAARSCWWKTAWCARSPTAGRPLRSRAWHRPATDFPCPTNTARRR